VSAEEGSVGSADATARGDAGIFAQQDVDAAIARLEAVVSKRRRPGA
jgi:hypothetical protein